MKFNRLTEKEKATIGVYRNSGLSCYLCGKQQSCGEGGKENEKKIYFCLRISVWRLVFSMCLCGFTKRGGRNVLPSNDRICRDNKN